MVRWTIKDKGTLLLFYILVTQEKLPQCDAYLKQFLAVDGNDGGRVGGNHRRELITEVTNVQLTLYLRDEGRRDPLVSEVNPVHTLVKHDT